MDYLPDELSVSSCQAVIWSVEPDLFSPEAYRSDESSQ